jgi:hypothetical protein
MAPLPGRPGVNGDPSIGELNRRLSRVEDRLDARMVTLDVYQAEKAAHTVEVASMDRRLTAIEESLQSATRLLIGAFLAIIGNVIFLAITTFGRP